MTRPSAATVTPAEMQRRIEEYRRASFVNNAPAQVVYQPPLQACPWDSCRYPIAGIVFRFDEWTTSEQRASLLKSWWLGPGLIGNCPKCGSPVLFGVTKKERASWQQATNDNRLPENWHQKAHLVSRSTLDTNDEPTD